MSTGDNVLTAISVGRECNIIDTDAEVFLGDVRKEGNREVVIWKSTKSERHNLSSRTLNPNAQFFKDEKKKPGYNITTSTYKLDMVSKEYEEKEKESNDIVTLEDYEWQHPPEEYAVALTGKVLNVLMSDPD